MDVAIGTLYSSESFMHEDPEKGEKNIERVIWARTSAFSSFHSLSQESVVTPRVCLMEGAGDV